MDRTSREPETRRAVGIVAGTGGPQALAEILAGLSRDFTAPILVVMSMRGYLLAPFVAWLGERCPLEVTVAADGDDPEPGRVYVGSGDPHLLIEQGRLRLRPGGSGDQPKDALFRSMARDLGPRAIAVVLTGMGRDGAEGMKEVRDAGGFTIAQDESTSLVYSTPRFAVEANAARESLPLEAIAPGLLELAG
jgi:two-component system chemotaxis response regulator CheB